MTAKWTFMVYMAGNNSLSGAAATDLAEMQKVGSTDAVKLLAFVKQRNAPARHVLVQKGGHDEVETLPPDVDSGAPQTVVDFVRWAVKRAPAERYALVLWNHGGGWAPDELDEIHQEVRGVRARHEMNRLGARKLSRAVFKTSIRTVLALPVSAQKAICYDDITGHALDTIEVERVLSATQAETRRPLDLFGMDACLMSGIEVAHQVRKLARTVVGSEEVEPNDGWCYDAILGDLAASPDMDGRALGKVVVARYVAQYEAQKKEWPITCSALDTAHVEVFGKAIDGLAKALRKTLPGRWSAIHAARTKAVRFDFDLVDVRSFCQALGAGDFPEDVEKAAAAVVETFEAGGYLVAEGHLGETVKGCGGLSIYLPVPKGEPLSKSYAELSFAKKHGWDGFLSQYLSSVKG